MQRKRTDRDFVQLGKGYMPEDGDIIEVALHDCVTKCKVLATNGYTDEVWVGVIVAGMDTVNRIRLSPGAFIRKVEG